MQVKECKDELAPKLLTVTETAQLLRMHIQTIYQYVWDGKLSSVRVGSRIKIPMESVENLLKR